MNISVIILFLIIRVNNVRSERDDDNEGQNMNNGMRLSYSDWIINTLNSTSSDIFWKNGLWQMYQYFKPIANYDQRREPHFITFNAREADARVY